MEDLISRQAAINAADSTDYTGLTIEDVKKVTDEVVKALKQLPSVQEQRWIPVTERLPEKHGAYLVYDKEEVLMGYYSTFDRDWTGMNGFPLVNVIAWMPLPEPYKAHMEGAEE